LKALLLTCDVIRIHLGPPNNLPQFFGGIWVTPPIGQVWVLGTLNLFLKGRGPQTFPWRELPQWVGTHTRGVLGTHRV